MKQSHFAEWVEGVSQNDIDFAEFEESLSQQGGGTVSLRGQDNVFLASVYNCAYNQL